jgi:hypothetical protein
MDIGQAQVDVQLVQDAGETDGLYLVKDADQTPTVKCQPVF